VDVVGVDLPDVHDPLGPDDGHAAGHGGRVEVPCGGVELAVADPPDHLAHARRTASNTTASPLQPTFAAPPADMTFG